MELSAYTLSCHKLPLKNHQACFTYSNSNGHHNCFSSRKNVNFCKRIQFNKIDKKHNFASISASGAESVAKDDTATGRWLLEPIGDGDSRHIGFKIPMPGAFEIASNSVTVGRIPEKADLVIPVATVSGVHARIQQNGRNLLVTDLDSTNGTFVGERRLKPGVSVRISSGSSVTFGDTHLAIFRVSKLDTAKSSTKSDQFEDKMEDETSKRSEVISESLDPSIFPETS